MKLLEVDPGVRMIDFMVNHLSSLNFLGIPSAPATPSWVRCGERAAVEVRTHAGHSGEVCQVLHHKQLKLLRWDSLGSNDQHAHSLHPSVSHLSLLPFHSFSTFSALSLHLPPKRSASTLPLASGSAFQELSKTLKTSRLSQPLSWLPASVLLLPPSSSVIFPFKKK